MTFITRNRIERLVELIEKTEDLTLVTDDERRYGKILFEICHEFLRTGKVGRPRKTLKKGVIVRVKNKGSQAHKKGRKKPKDQTTCPVHPETSNNILDNYCLRTKLKLQPRKILESQKQRLSHDKKSAIQNRRAAQIGKSW